VITQLNVLRELKDLDIQLVSHCQANVQLSALTSQLRKYIPDFDDVATIQPIAAFKGLVYKEFPI